MRRALLSMLLVLLPGMLWAQAQVGPPFLSYVPAAGGTWTGGAFTTPLLAPVGTAAAKPFAWSGAPGTGLFLPDQTAFSGTLIIGTGGAALSHAAGIEGQENTFVGIAVGNANTTGAQNSALGNEALLKNTTGNYNVAMGIDALRENTTGSSNAAFGTEALYKNTEGDSNSAFGVVSLYSNISGDANSGLGVYTLYANTTGNYNTAMGQNALNANTSGSYNTGVGINALRTNTTNHGSVAVGAESLHDSTGERNVAVGIAGLYSVSTGNFNTGIGSDSGYYSGATPDYANAVTTGTKLTLIGARAGLGSTTQRTNSTAIGYEAYVNADNTVVLGDENVTSVLAGSVSQAALVSRNTSISLTADSVVQYGQVVMPDASADGRFDINATNSTLAIGVLGGVGPSAQGTAYPVINSGLAYVVPQEDAAVTRGHYLIVSATAGCVNDSATVTTDGLNIGLSLYSEPVSHVIVIDGCGGGGCINTTTGAITLDTDVAALGWAVGQPVVYWDSGGTAPTGLTTGNVYFLKTVSTTTVTISATYGGAAVVPSDQGNDSTQYLLRLPQAVIAIH